MSQLSDSLARRITPEVVERALAAPSPLPDPHVEVPSAARAAVVVPIRFEPEPSVFVVVRSRALKEHAGELGFPGGKPLSPAESLRDAAFRELSEELAFGSDSVRELGRLRPVAVITGKYLITPFVAEVHAESAPAVLSGELEAVIPVALGPLISGGERFFAVITDYRGSDFALPHFRFEKQVLYGASAYIFFELLARLAHALGIPLPDPVIEEKRPWGDRYPF